MQAEMKAKVDLMASNFHELKSSFTWDLDLIKHFGAMITATRESKVNCDRVKEIRQYIKEETSWVSYFRGNNEFILALLLQGESDWRMLFQEAIKTYEGLKTHGFAKGVYLPLAAYVIAKNAEPMNREHVYAEMEQLYQEMKRHHFWLTSQDDYILAAVMASSDVNLERAAEETERCYTLLNAAGLYKGNELQSLTHVLALGEESAERKCDKTIKLYNALNASKCKLKYHGLANLGVLALVSDQPEQLAQEVIEVYEYLYGTKGYGFWGIDSETRAILASAIVADFYADQLGSGLLESTLTNSITAVLIAQQTAMLAAVCATSAAVSASTSS